MKIKQKRRKIANLLLKNYLILYFLSTMILVATFFLFSKIYNNYNEEIIKRDSKIIANEIMRDDYKSIDASTILNMDGYMHVLDYDLNVIYRQGNINKNITKYDRDKFFSIITNKYNSNKYDDSYFYSFEYNEKNNFFLLIAVPEEEFYSYNSQVINEHYLHIILGIIGFYLVSLILIIYMYSKFTAKTFLIPLYNLIEGTKKIANGDYSSRIMLESNTEFYELKNTFNFMAEKIENEIIKRKSMEEKLKKKATIDEFTGIFNRETGLEILSEKFKDAKENNYLMSICYIDLNNLKAVNDRLGHNKGDEYIKECVQIIKKVIRENDIFMRLGGDEFLIIFTKSTLEDVEKVWNRIKKNICYYNMNNTKEYELSMSHGIETLYNNNFDNVQEFIESADSKMYIEKKLMKGKNVCSI